MAAGDLTTQQRAVAYYATAGLLTAFGVLGMASIGLPFLVAGVLLLALGPVRHRRDVLWPPLVGVAAFVAAFLVLAPAWCSSGPLIRQRCASVVGFEIPWGIALPLAFSVAVGTAVLVRRRLRLSRRAAP
jgi:hypothetical protein